MPSHTSSPPSPVCFSLSLLQLYFLFSPPQLLYRICHVSCVSFTQVWKSDLVMKVNPPTTEEAALLESRVIMSLFWPAQNKELLEQMAKQGATVLAMDQLPRTLSRGQVDRGLPTFVTFPPVRVIYFLFLFCCEGGPLLSFIVRSGRWKRLVFLADY